MSAAAASSSSSVLKLKALKNFQELLHELWSDPQSFTVLDQKELSFKLKSEEHQELCDLLLSLSPYSFSLKSLTAYWDGVDEKAAACYARLLLSCPSLEHLYFYSTNMGEKGFGLILHSLHSSSSSFPSLTHLSFYWDDSIGRGGEKAFLPLSEMLRSSNAPPRLQSLTLQFIQMNAKAAGLLASSLNTSIRSLDISNNEDIEDEGVEYIAKMLHLNTSLDILNLANTGFSGVGAQFLATALTLNTSLTTLDISFNDRIGEKGMDCFQHPLITTSLKHLHFHCARRIYPSFINILQRTATLTTLNLRLNREKNPSRVEELFKAVAQHKNLQSVDLEDCPAVKGGKVVSCIVDAIRLNSSLTEINLKGTPLAREGKTSQFIQAIHDNIKMKISLRESKVKEAIPNIAGLPLVENTPPQSPAICQKDNIIDCTNSKEDPKRPTNFDQSGPYAFCDLEMLEYLQDLGTPPIPSWYLVKYGNAAAIMWYIKLIGKEHKKNMEATMQDINTTKARIKKDAKE